MVVAQDATFIFPLERPSMGNYLRNKEFDESGGSPPSPTGDGGYLLYLWNGSWTGERDNGDWERLLDLE